MKRFKHELAGLLALSLALAPQAFAHHSFAAQYDSTKVVTLKGYVTKVEWFNPHVYFYIDVDNVESGKPDSWAIEMGPPHMLQDSGWKKNSMQIGDEVEVVATRARDGSLSANARSVTLAASGEVLGAASSEQQTLTGGGARRGGQ
jgi:hypothetical protein